MKLTLGILIVGLLFAGCSTITNISVINLAHQYNPETNPLTPSHQITHTDEALTNLSIRIPSNQLLYVRDAREEYFLGRFEVSLSVHESFGRRGQVFRNEVQFTDTLYLDEERIVKRDITFPLAMGKHYIIHVSFTDLNRRVAHKSLINTDKSTLFSRDFFRFAAERNDQTIPLPYNSLPLNEEITLQHTTGRDFLLEAFHYQLSNNYPLAPYVITEGSQPEIIPSRTDTRLDIALTNGSGTLSLHYPGVYRISKAGSVSDGFHVASFWETFPSIPANNQLLYPLRYITSLSEFESLFALGDAELAAERFWTRSTGNPDRGAALMNRYLNRVAEANVLFTTFVPGWQTDRGMIYIIYGPPQMVYRNDQGETWHYRETMNTPYLEFNFIRIQPFYTEYELILERKSQYRSSWNQAVSRWRR